FCTYLLPSCIFFLFFNDTSTTDIYTLSLHDALPISFGFSGAGRRPCPFSFSLADEGNGAPGGAAPLRHWGARALARRAADPRKVDRKSTRLNSSHVAISYAVFCLKKKNKNTAK